MPTPLADENLFPDLAAYWQRIASAELPLAESRAAAVGSLCDWLRKVLAQHGQARLVVVCTGNSRRSVLGALLGNACASYLGLPARFFSAGTEPSAVNARTLRALADVGFRVTPTGAAAPRGPAGEPNPIYNLAWSDAPTGQMREYSKSLADPSLPKSNFAAILVCDEANAACPLVPGAACRIALPFQDPKACDGRPQEASAYRQRRDEIAHILLAALSQAQPT